MTSKKRIALAIAAVTVPAALAAAPAMAGVAHNPAPHASATHKPGTHSTTTHSKPGAHKPAARPAAAGRTITVTTADNGKHVRVHKGEYVLVRLRLDPRANPDATTWWRAIRESGRPLQVRPQTAVSVRGTTRGRYKAVAPGSATLSSSRAVCPAHGTTPTCHSMQSWTVTVDVTAK
ncbi:hypothetical protein ACQP2F_22305 [Actinoplanes sp. CA-030573]|uniref:hypothetical protein n=1 Tax=Actinoplanes sp. CA-030573 TaxID=3239898 RepID=UPI003D8AE02D